MLDKIKRLGSDTAVYGISTVLGRFLTFLLTPLYTHVLPAEDLGVVATVYAYVAFLNVLYGYGMESAYMKYVSTGERGNAQEVFSVPFMAVVATGALFSGGLMLAYRDVALLSGVPELHAATVVMAAGILFLDVAALIPFASLRMASRARTFALIKTTGIVINVACNVVFLFVLRRGVEGIFLSGLISSGAALALLVPTIVRNFTVSRPHGLLPALLRFGLPSVPSGIASMLIQVINRPMLGVLSGAAAVGLFQANYRLGIFMMLLVSMFDFAWRPFFLTHAHDADARPLFARVLTYFVLLGTTVWITLTFFLADIVRWPIFNGHPLIAPRYWEGLSIVPVILLAYLILGIYNNLVAGIYIEKETRRLPAVTFAAAAVNVLANYILIPPFGLMGAAVATLLSYLVMAVLMGIIVRRIYPVPYETARLAKIAVSAFVVMVPGLWVGDWSFAIPARAVLLLLFVLLLVATRFFEAGEWQALQRLWRAVFSRGRSEPPVESPS